MSATTSSRDEVRTYGGWRAPRSAGVGALTMAETMFLLGGMIVVVMVYVTFGVPWAGGVLALGGPVLYLVVTKDKHGVSIMDRRLESLRFSRARRRGANRYVSGPLAPRYTTGGFRAPGVLWRTTLSEHEDVIGRRFALLRHGDGSMAVVMGLSPAGTRLVDLDQANDLVALWGQWLASLSGEAGVVAASAVVETCPDSGERLRRAVARQASAQAPAAARAVMDEVVESSASGADDIRVWATLTFSPSSLGAGRRRLVEREIATRLPGLTQTLQYAGTGAVHLLTAQEVCVMTRVAFDPASAPLFDTAASRGQQVSLSWGEAGPAGHETSWDSYRHDSGTSRVWTMSSPPSGTVQFTVLAPILGMHPDVERKRVALLYLPMDSAKAPDAIDADVNQASARLDSRARPRARDVREAQITQQMADEEAAGAGLVDIGAIITCTTTTGGIDEASAPVESLAASSRLIIRPAWGAQDSGFAVGLPLGLTPGDQSMGGGR
ncbi:hypothetical protein SAMN05216246_11237 [Actinomyces denticolens]|uniref:Type VII secretion protein EccE n=1 Tax=Actinomyces denticolens TaxID=52767 RepID=A0ABY1IGF1_9ACTO|nr:SCO6880 family protein [Actinomyces denticolens]SHJ13743.1 hypothetical protein SAMN05216246_11237 [Actinomyces denticolens]